MEGGFLLFSAVIDTSKDATVSYPLCGTSDCTYASPLNVTYASPLNVTGYGCTADRWMNG